MSISSPPARLVGYASLETLDVVGPTVQFLVPLPEDDDAPFAFRGAIPPGGVVPLHSHADPETFVAMSGQVEGLVHDGNGFRWVRIAAGDVFHVPGAAKHAFRNRSGEPATQIVITTARIGRFLREIAVPAGPGEVAPRPPSPEAITRFLKIAARYGYWNATPEENAKVGIWLVS